MAMNWRRIKTEMEFQEAFADKTFVGEGAVFTIHSDGRMTGGIGDSHFLGQWYWDSGYFCRTAILDGEALELDCEVIEILANQMRYTRGKGAGRSTVVTIA